MESPITFGGWLRQRRNELRLTREELARRIGCSVSTLRKIEDGERRPSGQIAELMAKSLDIPPATRTTFVRVARGELSVDRLASASMPMTAPGHSSTSSTLRHSLPIIPTPVIGRQREVGALSQLLRDPQCRLLTLVGPGGIGKTRLAIETAAQIQDVFAAGVHFVPLAAVNSPRSIVPAIADVIGFAFQSPSHAQPKTQLFSYLKEKNALLLLDNLEHLLVEPGIEVLAELLANAPRVKLLVTSRESLELQSEWVFEVRGLPVPESRYTEESAKDTSVELFLQRARRAHVGFNASTEDYPPIVRICELVEGMPLGIELAATWVRTLTCDEIAREIERGVDFLSVSTRDLPSRHRSLQAVFGHSWKLLTEEERATLLRLSVFRGGFQRETARAVAGATLAVLSALVAKSLIRRIGTGRYDLHEVIRQLAAGQFASQPDERTATLARHSEYFLTYFSRADERFKSPVQRETLGELLTEMDNFRTAWDWAVAHGDFALIEQTMRLLPWVYDTRGWFLEGLDALGRAVNALETAHVHSPPDRTDQVALAHLLTGRSLLAYRLGQYEQAQAMLERALAILRPLNELRVLVEAVHLLGMVLEVTGDYANALELYSEGLQIARAIGDRWYAALCLIHLNGLVAITHRGVDLEHTHEQLQFAVAEWRLIGDPRFTAFALRLFSQSAFSLGWYDEARAALEESAALNLSVGDRWGSGAAYRGLGVVAQARGQHQHAVAMFRKSLDTFIELGGGWWVARVLAEMGRSVFALGNEAKAESIWHESLRIATETHGTPVMLEALADLARLQAKRGNFEEALELLLIVLNHPAGFQETKTRARHLCMELEAQLTSEHVDAVRGRVQAKTLEATVHGILKHLYDMTRTPHAWDT
ncbi:MAG: tetratricopeptide repeat protein [Anaerolineae bacterium]